MTIANSLTDRQRTILDLLREDAGVTVGKLSEALGVSAVTIRSDLNRLAGSGYVIRTHGGALPAYHPNIVERRRRRVAEKGRIARAAADLIADGDHVMICAGTTAARIAQHLLGKRDVYVVTNSTLLYAAARVNPGVHITVVGGEFRPSGEALVGPLALHSLEQFHVKTAFLGTDGFSLEEGITAHLVDVAEVVRRMAGQAERTVLVADSSKYGHVGFAHILPLTDIDTVITDTDFQDEDRAALAEAGLEVLTV